MSEAQQNKYINQLRRQLVNAVERIKTLELDLEPEGRITEAFEAMERHIEENSPQSMKNSPPLTSALIAWNISSTDYRLR